MRNNNIKLICFDLDKTIIKENSWYSLNMAMGLKPNEDNFLLQRYLNGLIDYQRWQKELLKIYKQSGRANFKTIYQALNNFTYQTGIKEIVKYLKNKNYQIVLISGSVDILIDKIAKDLSIQLFAACNSFVFNKQGYLKDILTCQKEGLKKLEILEKFCQKLNIKIDQCAYVGDGDNDIEIFLKTRHGITFRGSKTEKEAWKIIDELKELKFIF